MVMTVTRDVVLSHSTVLPILRFAALPQSPAHSSLARNFGLITDSEDPGGPAQTTFVQLPNQRYNAFIHSKSQPHRTFAYTEQLLIQKVQANKSGHDNRKEQVQV